MNQRESNIALSYTWYIQQVDQREPQKRECREGRRRPKSALIHGSRDITINNKGCYTER